MTSHARTHFLIAVRAVWLDKGAGDEVRPFWVNCKGLGDSSEREKQFLSTPPPLGNLEEDGCSSGEMIRFVSRKETADVAFLGCDIGGMLRVISWDLERAGASWS